MSKCSIHLRASLVAVSCAAGLNATSTVAQASVLGDAIASDVDVKTYRHYHQDQLYTYAGDNRGFGLEHDLARDNIESTLLSFGLSVELEPFSYSGQTYYNVVATQTGYLSPNRVVVVGAHFDSVNNPGSDDNATGTALVMEVARVLAPHQTPFTIRYVLFDREEQGLVGSSAYVSSHSSELTLFALTADMVGHDSGAHGHDIFGTSASSSLVTGMASAIGNYGSGLNAFTNIGTFAFSDHWSFESAGIPACVIIEDCYNCNGNYHTQNDATDFSPTYIDYDMVADLTRSVVGYLVDQVGITVSGDANRDGAVNVDDIVAVILEWGDCPDSPASCDADITRDDVVNVDDLIEVILNWQG